MQAALCNLKTISSDFNTFWCPPNPKVLSRTNHWRSRPWPWSLSHHRSSSPHRKWPRTWPSPLSWLHQSNHQNQRMWVKPVPLPSGSWKKCSDSSTKFSFKKKIGLPTLGMPYFGMSPQQLVETMSFTVSVLPVPAGPAGAPPMQKVRAVVKVMTSGCNEVKAQRKMVRSLLVLEAARNDLSRAWWQVAHSSPCVLRKMQWTLACVTASLEKICEETEETRQKCKNHGKTTSADGWTAWYS